MVFRAGRAKGCFLLFLLFLSFSLRAQTVSGTVTDGGTGETLIGATILDQKSGKGTVTDAHGRYTLTLKGSHEAQLRISYVGYQTQNHTVNLDGNPMLNVVLQPAVELQEVVVTADRVNSPKVAQMSAVEVPVEQIKLVPVIFGESDVLKAIQLLPGVQSGTEGASGIYVRGGGPDENLFLLDGIPLYNVNHMGGFFSAFNSDAVKNVTLYKGSFPARFTGRISSVLDITTNNGNDKEWHGGASVGAIAAKVNVEGPIVKERTTLSFSLRRTYFDALMQPMFVLMSNEIGFDRLNAGYYFYDLNAKVTHRFSDRSRLYASFYSGDDAIYFKVKNQDFDYDGYSSNEYMSMNYGWGNMAAAVRWNYVLTPRLFMNLTGAYTRYRNKLTLGVEADSKQADGTYYNDELEMSYNSGIQDVIARADFDYSPVPEHNVKFGAVMTHHLFTPEVTGFKLKMDASGTTPYNLDRQLGESRVRAEEMVLYGEDDWSVAEALKINAGVALTGFAVEGRFYPSVQPRLSGRFLLTDELSLKMGYAYLTQYLHLLSTSNISLPTDLWVPVTSIIPPMNSHQVAAGVFYNWHSIVDFSVEGYYKWMNNLMEYKPGSSFMGSSTSWESKVCLGRGWAYGIEFLAQKTVGDITGWLGYTWSRTMRQFDDINNGEVFPAKYDRIHDISLTLQYKRDEQFDCGVTWVYSTGNTATLGLQQFEGQTISALYGDYGYTNTYDYIESRNNFRMPSYHRMDISVNFHKKRRYGVRTWNISVYNLYNRQNPLIIYRGYKKNTFTPVLKQLSLFPIIPSVSYIYKF